MRTIRTIILRLLVDTDQPQSLRGMMNAMPDDHPHPFTDEQTLLAQLHHIIGPQDGLPDQPESEGGPLTGSHRA